MKEQGQDLAFRRGVITEIKLFRFDFALDDGIRGLEVTGIRHERQMNLTPIRIRTIVGRSQVILDIPRITPVLRVLLVIFIEIHVRTLEFLKDLLNGLSNDIRQDIQASTMRHTQHNMLDS